MIPTFETKKELFSYLVKNKSELIALKKSAIKHSDPLTIENESFELKGISYANEDNISEGSIKRVIIGNTYNWMDSHDDVHIPGLFAKSIKENKNIWHLHDHQQMITAKVGIPISITDQPMAWADLGVMKNGETNSLLLYSDIKRSYNQFIFDQYLTKQINQHSVGMVYVNLFMAINDPEYKDEYTNWNRYSPNVANIDKAINKGYFWAVTEAKLIEISAVLQGSNELTPTIEPQKSTPKEPESTQKIDYKYLRNNFKL
jgi:hypothetical protein